MGLGIFNFSNSKNYWNIGLDSQKKTIHFYNCTDPNIIDGVNKINFNEQSQIFTLTKFDSWTIRFAWLDGWLIETCTIIAMFTWIINCLFDALSSQSKVFKFQMSVQLKYCIQFDCCSRFSNYWLLISFCSLLKIKK